MRLISLLMLAKYSTYVALHFKIQTDAAETTIPYYITHSAVRELSLLLLVVANVASLAVYRDEEWAAEV